MRKRAELVDQTRQRIVEAAVALHTTIGPAATTTSALAEHAGVTRLTVYRHFPDEDDLFAACTAHWFAAHPPPDPAPWATERDVRARVRRAIADLYGWYERDGNDLVPIRRDRESMPPGARVAAAEADAAVLDLLLDGSPLRGRARQRARAAVAHAIDVLTWHDLVAEHGLRTGEAADLAAAFAEAALGG